MQKRHYEQQASQWNLNNRDPVVGSFDLHNRWPDYDLYLFPYTTYGHALDFACGPGRNIVKFNNRFEIIDGVDISETNIQNAKTYIKANNIEIPNLYVCNGKDLQIIGNDLYDTVFSTIAMQHICVWQIRYGYFQEFYRILKSQGRIAIQMGYGGSSRPHSSYYDNNYTALTTNGGHDVSIENPQQLEKDLTSLGFVDFKYTIAATGPGDFHKNWIYFSAKKP